MGYKTWATGEILTAVDVMTYLMKQAVIVCTSGTRPTPVEGMTIYETDTDRTLTYNGATWSVFARLDVANTFTSTLQATKLIARPASGGISADMSDSVNSSLRISHPASGVLRYDLDGGNSHQWAIGGTQYALLQTTGMTVNGGLGVTGAVSSASLGTGALAASTGAFSAAVGIAAGYALNTDYVAARGDTGAYLQMNPGAGMNVRGRSAGIVPFSSHSASAGTSTAVFSDDVRSTLTVTHPATSVAGLDMGASEELIVSHGGTASLRFKSDSQAIAAGVTNYCTNLWVRYRKDYTITPAYFSEQVTLGNPGGVGSTPVPAGYRPLVVPE